MRAKRGSDGDIISPIVSARINTRLAFAFRYGHMEVRAKLPAGDWIWPGICLISSFVLMHRIVSDRVKKVSYSSQNVQTS